jgi:hypothetical protein
MYLEEDGSMNVSYQKYIRMCGPFVLKLILTSRYTNSYTPLMISSLG